MANNSKRQDLKDIENLIRETNEKYGSAIPEVGEQNSKAMEEIKTMIAKIALQNTEMET